MARVGPQRHRKNVTLINKRKRDLVILSQCQFYIKALLIYTLKLASWKSKHVAAVFFELILFYVLKLC